MKKVDRAQSQLRRALRALDASQLGRLSSSLPASERDSDDDGLSDDLEDGIGSGTCDSDSNDDGISDGDGLDDGLRPERLETKGIVAAISSSSITIGTTAYGLTADTRYQDGDDNPLDLGSLTVGQCVELKFMVGNASTQPPSLVAVEIEQEDSSDCSPDLRDDDDDDDGDDDR